MVRRNHGMVTVRTFRTVRRLDRRVFPNGQRGAESVGAFAKDLDANAKERRVETGPSPLVLQLAKLLQLTDREVDRPSVQSSEHRDPVE